MENFHNTNRGLRWTVFGAVMAVALLWAWSTQHVWEDYYITYRSSKNLATGHGLVFNQGDRLHTFTSPLGVLLPAVACLVTGTHSDNAAIWVFRVWSAAALAGGVLLLLAVARRFRFGGFAAVALGVFIVLDGKTLDFTINGMETGFLLLFIAYTLWALFACPGRRWLHLGLAWGGLMWTRPDGFLYVALSAAGVFFFNDAARTGLMRAQWLKLFIQAGAVCTAVYLPWFLWSWSYYGTPIPHTITAKGNVVLEQKTALGVVKTLLDFPTSVWEGATSLEGAFLPSYYQIGGWPTLAVKAARWVALLLAFQWVLPLWRVEVRVASFAFCGMHVYLTYFPYFPFPWYLPGTTLLAALTVAGMIAQLLAAANGAGWQRWFRGGVVGVVFVAFAAQGWLSWQMKREMTDEQVYSDTGTRRKIGEWLKAHAQPGDTVLMEPLGYIGYFSGLKTYDFPGLSSREMVNAIHALGSDGGIVAEFLCPDWIVLRPWEHDKMMASVHRLFDPEGGSYELVKEFNNLPEVEKLHVYGRKLIEHDARFAVYKRRVPKRYRLDPTLASPFDGLGLIVQAVGDQRMYQVHAAGIMSFRVPAGATQFRIGYGMPDRTWTDPVKTDGASFLLRWMDGRKTELLMSRTLTPVTNPKDRGLHEFETDLPPHGDDAVIILITQPGATDPMDWTCWGNVEFL